MKRCLLLLSAMSMLPIMGGCGSFSDEPIYNVGYKWDYDKRRYEVYAYNGDQTDYKTYYVTADNYHYVEVAEYKTYVYELPNGDKYTAIVNNEYHNSHLYIYHKR